MLGLRTKLASLAGIVFGALQTVGVVDVSPEKLQSVGLLLVSGIAYFLRDAVGRSRPAKPILSSSLGGSLFLVTLVVLVAGTSVGCASTLEQGGEMLERGAARADDTGEVEDWKGSVIGDPERLGEASLTGWAFLFGYGTSQIPVVCIGDTDKACSELGDRDRVRLPDARLHSCAECEIEVGGQSYTSYLMASKVREQ